MNVCSLLAPQRRKTSPSCCGTSPLKMRENIDALPETQKRKIATTVLHWLLQWWTTVCNTCTHLHTPGTQQYLNWTNPVRWLWLYPHTDKEAFSISFCACLSPYQHISISSLFSVRVVDNTLTVIIVSVLGGVIGLVIIVMVIKALVVHTVSTFLKMVING